MDIGDGRAKRPVERRSRGTWWGGVAGQADQAVSFEGLANEIMSATTTYCEATLGGCLEAGEGMLRGGRGDVWGGVVRG